MLTLETPMLANLSWKELDVDASLATLREHVENEAQRQIDWYHAKRKVKASISTGLRFVAILLFCLLYTSRHIVMPVDGLIEVIELDQVQYGRENLFLQNRHVGTRAHQRGLDKASRDFAAAG